MTSTRSAIILGATGAVGTPLVGELVNSSKYDQIHAFVRKSFKTSSSYKDEAKLIEHVIDFDELLKETEDQQKGQLAEELRKVEAEEVYITLGTTRAIAGSAEAFEKIDRKYVLAGAKAALNTNVQHQKVLYCSSFGSNAKSSLLYPKSKGLTEEGLAALGYSDTIIFKPGFLANANRQNSRAMENVYGLITHHVLSRVWNNAEIKVTDLAKAFRVAGEIGSSGLTSKGVGSPPSDTFNRGNPEGKSSGTVTIISNVEAQQLANQST